MKKFKISGAKITNRDYQTTDRYFKEISSKASLTIEEESILFKRYKEYGDQVAFDKLILSNSKFVISVAKGYQTKNVALADLISEGNIGLIRAVNKYDETKGFKFFSYAVWWIRQSIMSYLSEKHRIIRLPNNKSQELVKIKKFVDSFYKKYGSTPSSDEVCLVLGLSEESYNRSMDMSHEIKSLSQTISNDGDELCFEDQVSSNFFDAPDQKIDMDDLKNGVQGLLKILTKRESDIIMADFEFRDHQGNIIITREHIQQMYDVTETRINQLKQRAIITLRSRYGIKSLKKLLC